MQKIKEILFLILCLLVAYPVSAKDIRDILGTLGRSDSSSTGKGISDILGTVNKLTGNDKIDYKDLVGTWKYADPAVAFKSDNVLKNAGGIAASTAVENKIRPYYEKAGINGLTIIFENDSSFVMQVKKTKLKGSVNRSGDENFTFKFNAFGKTKIGQMEAFVNKETSNKITLTFDASKLITLVDKISQFSGNSSLKTISSILNNYDGMTIGFKLSRQTK